MADFAAHNRRRQVVASPNGIHSQREDHNHNRHKHHQHPRRNQNDLGMTTSRRATSPVADDATVARSSEAIQDRERDKKEQQAHPHRPRHNPQSPPPPLPPPSQSQQAASQISVQSSQNRRHDRSRSPDRRTNRTSRPSERSPHARRDHRNRGRELIRGREPRLSPDRHRPRPNSPRPRGDTREHLPPPPPPPRRRASRSPVPSKRPHSPTSSLRGRDSQAKKSRRDNSPGRTEKDVTTKSLPPKDHRNPSPSRRRRSRSPEYRDRRRSRSRSRSRQRRRTGRSKSPGSSHRYRSRSRGPEEGTAVSQPLSRQRSKSPRQKNRSPGPNQRRRSRSRHRSPATRGGRPQASPSSGLYRKPSSDPNSSRAPHGGFQPGSPRDSRSSNPTQKEGNRPGSRSSNQADRPVSGSNSIEVNMAARGGFRGGFNPQQQQQQRGHGQTSGRGTPTSSFHGSPPAQSPYNGGGRGWNGQHQFSPQGQYSSQYPQNNHGPPTAPQSHFQSNPAQSPPHPPTGPASQYNQGPYRGGHRGGSGAFRGSQFGPGRGGHRGGFKSAQWSPPSHNNTQQSPNNPEKAPETGNVTMRDTDSLPRSSKDLQAEEPKKEQPKDEKAAPLGRPPPTGPQSQTPNKFSFSMKNATKPVVTAPRPEISSKFNAPVAPRAPAADLAPKQPPTGPERDRSGAPRNAPREPASARGRSNDHRRPPEQPRQQDPVQPKTRKVKKIMKRLKEKPKLPEDLVKSKSVYYRKPGNESVVGSGTYGKVFKGLNVYTKKLVALKRIRMEGERDGFPVTAVREIKLLRSLSHRNVVHLQEVMVEGNECFMVFEYLSHDLTGLLNHPSFVLEPAQKKHLAQQMFEGLDYLHTRGVLHRDIKAANILVSNEGILKLADFGLARFYAKHRQLDYTNRVITIWYRSPELLLGETRYGPAVDIWSAACVLVEIFTKHAIFPGDGSEINQLEKIHAVMGTPNRKEWPNLPEMPWFELLRPQYRKPNVFEAKYKDLVTPEAFDLLAQMLQYDPDKRPTAAQVLQHPYFVTEEPAPRQAIELKNIHGEWHEFESKALRREKEKKEKERAKLAQGQSLQKGDGKATDSGSGTGSRDRKRPIEGGGDIEREAKRPHVESKSEILTGPSVKG
ncbi:hypothetical protein QBC38DRAFT_527560 [Podospora fimiseda]|uniref:cyclin-dependent kinase n=1 Tax=Podospora fimiseda TaxID=252190 RepID=A0AAN7H240_9PEZI|nr:hypothetical protein QBC38DRAFT_527560 [Podospora fimiseda]